VKARRVVHASIVAATGQGEPPVIDIATALDVAPRADDGVESARAKERKTTRDDVRVARANGRIRSSTR
jgi:hypothetical protein